MRLLVSRCAWWPNHRVALTNFIEGDVDTTLFYLEYSSNLSVLAIPGRTAGVSHHRTIDACLRNDSARGRGGEEAQSGQSVSHDPPGMRQTPIRWTWKIISETCLHCGSLAELPVTFPAGTQKLLPDLRRLAGSCRHEIERNFLEPKDPGLGGALGFEELAHQLGRRLGVVGPLGQEMIVSFPVGNDEALTLDPVSRHPDLEPWGNGGWWDVSLEWMTVHARSDRQLQRGMKSSGASDSKGFGGVEQ